MSDKRRDEKGARPVSDELDRLAWEAVHGSEDQVNSALRRLEGPVRKIAYDVLQKIRLPEEPRRAFLEKAISYIWERLRNWDPMRGCFRAWAYRVLANKAVDIARTRQVRKNVVPRDPSALNNRRAPDTPPAVPESDGAQLAQLRSVLEQCPQRDRVVWLIVCEPRLDFLEPGLVQQWLAAWGAPKPLLDLVASQCSAADRKQRLAAQYRVSVNAIEKIVSRTKRQLESAWVPAGRLRSASPANPRRSKRRRGQAEEPRGPNKP